MFGFHQFDKDSPKGPRIQRGHLGYIILKVLHDKPMHGYEIIRTLEEKSHGFWRPSAGSIYPSLQLLEEQGFITTEEVDGKKTHTLTESGREEAEKMAKLVPWAKMAGGKDFPEMMACFKGMLGALKSIGHEGSAEDIAAAKKIITRASEDLEAIASNIKK